MNTERTARREKFVGFSITCQKIEVETFTQTFADWPKSCFKDKRETSRHTLTFSPPLPYQRFMPTCCVHSFQPSYHSVHVSPSSTDLGGIHYPMCQGNDFLARKGT